MTIERGPENLPGKSPHTAEFDGQVYNVDLLKERAELLQELEVKTEDLQRQLQGKYWNTTDGSMIGPTDIIEAYRQAEGDWNVLARNHPNFGNHIERIRNSDYQDRPILLTQKDETMYVIDGMHRLTKAMIDEAETIRTKRFESLPEDAMIIDAD